MDDGVSVKLVHGGHDAVLELLFGCDTNVAQDGAGELGEETLDEIEPGAVLGREGEFELTGRRLGEPSLGLLGDLRRMIVEDQLDRCVGRIRGIEELEELNEFAAAVAVLDEGVDLAKQELKDRIMAAMDHFNRDPVVHTWFYKLDRAARSHRNCKSMN